MSCYLECHHDLLCSTKCPQPHSIVAKMLLMKLTWVAYEYCGPHYKPYVVCTPTIPSYIGEMLTQGSNRVECNLEFGTLKSSSGCALRFFPSTHLLHNIRYCYQASTGPQLH